jgi:hypothetical protein
MQPVWELLGALPSRPVRQVNPQTMPTRAVTWDNPDLFPVIYQAADGTALLTVTNLGETNVTATVAVDPASLGLPGTVRLTPVCPQGTTAAAGATGLTVKALPPLHFCGAVIRPA